MDKGYLIDTNIIIYYLNDNLPDSSLDLIERVFQYSFNISTITKIELLGWQKIDNFTLNKIKEFLNNSNIYYIDSQIEKRAIEIKQNCKTSIPDAIIAATALQNDFTLVTRNTKDFNTISNLNIFNPFQ